MKTPLPNAILLSLLLLTGVVLGSHADDLKMKMPAGGAPLRSGPGSLKDPSGMSHSRLALMGKVGVVIFSVPDMSQGPSQRRWSDLLARNPESKLPDKIALVLIENMAQAGPFRDEARDDMKDQFGSKKRPFLLLDESGATFKRFGIGRDQTEILIFDKTGTVRDVEDNLDDREQTLGRIKAITAQLSRHS